MINKTRAASIPRNTITLCTLPIIVYFDHTMLTLVPGCYTNLGLSAKLVRQRGTAHAQKDVCHLAHSGALPTKVDQRRTDL
jgi:hypothetical protein